MLTPKEQAVIDLRQQGWSCARIAEHLGISRNAEKFRAWSGRQRLAKGDPLTLPGVYCVFRCVSYTGVLPRRYLPDWLDRIWAARQHIRWLAGLNRRPDVEILLGGIMPLTAREAAIARRLLAGKREPGVYEIEPNGNATVYSGETTAGRAEGVSNMAIHYRRERGHGHGCYWL